MSASYSYQSPTSEKDIESYIERIREDVNREKYGTALAACQHLINSKNAKRVGYRERAEIWQSLRETELAISDLKELVALNKPEPADYYNLGIAYLKQTEAKEAVKAFTQAIDLGDLHQFPYYTQSCRFHRAVAFLRLGMREQALDDCRAVEDGYRCHVPLQGVMTKEELMRQALEL